MEEIWAEAYQEFKISKVAKQEYCQKTLLPFFSYFTQKIPLTFFHINLKKKKKIKNYDEGTLGAEIII